MNTIRIPANFDLAQTLDCGQAFRWRRPEPGRALPDEEVNDINGKEGGASSVFTQRAPRMALPDEDGGVDRWSGVAGDRALTLEKDGEELVLTCSQEDFDAFWRDYFDLSADYDALRARLSALSPALAAAIQFAPGIRILRQDPWEALCSFLISQNNNIPRIKGIIEHLCAMLGRPIPGTEFFSFPAPEALARCSVEDLAPLRAGYRAKYLIDAGQKVVSGQVDLTAIQNAPADFGRQELCKILGVGPKVAECVLLYGFHKTECFPMDVWMKRAMATLLPSLSPGDFGEAAGVAQQYLFHYSRNHPELF